MEFRRELPLAVGKAPAPKVAEFRAAMTAAGARRSSQEGKKQPQPKQQQKQQQQQQEEEAAHNKRETAAAQGDTGEVEQEQQSAAAAGVICCRCGVDAPDLLLLQCQHLLCLPCAAAQLLLQSQQNPLSPYNCLLCPCCSKETLLSDKATATLVRQQPHAPRHQTRQQASATATAEAAAAAAAAGAAAVAGGLRGPSGGKEEVLLPAAAAAADAAADTEWQFICCTCEKRISVVFCRDCAANFCKDCAVETHAPRGADPSVVARLSQHRFSPLSSRGVCPTLPLSNAARCKLRAIDHYKRLDDCEPFLEVAAAAAASASAGAASGASKTAAARGGLTKQQQQQRQSGRRRSAAESSSIKQQLLEEEISEGDSSRVSLEEVVNTRVPVNAFPRLCSVSSVPCDLHAGKPSQFFCCSCGGPAVCAECIISGPHQRHPVVSVETAWLEALGRVEIELNAAVERTEEDVASAQAVLRDCRAEWSSSLAQDKQLLSLTLFQVKRQLQEKQKETLAAFAAFIEGFSAECNAFRTLIHTKMKLLETRCAAVAEKKGALDPHLLLTYLGDEYTATQKLIDANIPASFKHLPDSRNALLDNLQQTTIDLLGHLAVLRSKIQNKQSSNI